MSSFSTVPDDEKMQIYVNAMLPCFEKIQESAARLAGLLVEDELVGRSTNFDNESRLIGLRARDEAQSLLGGADFRKGDAHFHHHLELAMQRLIQAWSALENQRQGLVAARDPLPALKAAWTEIQAASRILPGFDTVDFRNSCCAMHQRLNTPLS